MARSSTAANKKVLVVPFALCFRRDPFVVGRWIYGRQDKDGNYYLRGQLDATREDMEEVLKRETEARL